MNASDLRAIQSVDMQEARAVLRQVEPHLAPEQYAMLEGLLATYSMLLSQLSEKTASLARIRRLFRIDTSERLVPTATPAAAPNEAAPTSAEPCADDDSGGSSGTGAGADPKPKKHKRKGHGRRRAADTKAKTNIVPLKDAVVGQCCEACARGKLYKLPPGEPVLRILGQPVFTAESWVAERLRCGGCGAVYTAQLPPEAVGPKYNAPAVAMLASLHYLLGMPFDRLEKMQEDLMVPFPASIQWKLLNASEAMIRPVHEALERGAAGASLFHIDDTHARILELMGKRGARLREDPEFESPERTGVFTTGILALDPSAYPVALFVTGRKHAGENIAALLELRDPSLPIPTIMCDALSRNVPPGVKASIANCIAHARRGVFDLVGLFPEHARHVLEEMALVFALDARAKRDNLSEPERLRLHQSESAPILGRLRKWIRTQLYRAKTVEPNSELGKAFVYILKHWKKLTLFLRKAGVPLTNNACERLLKICIRYRRNSAFYRNLRGARVADVFMSLMHTARLNGENPVEYITALLEHADQIASAPERWLPWNFRATLAAAADATPSLTEAVAA